MQQSNEAQNECWSDASRKNFYGLLPFGQYFDDPSEPGPNEFMKQKMHNSSLIEKLTEFGTYAP